MSEPKICPFRNAGVLVDGKSFENVPLMIHTKQPYTPAIDGEPDLVLGVACCEEKCALWDVLRSCCAILSSVRPSVGPIYDTEIPAKAKP